MSLLFNNPGIYERDVLEAYNLYKEQNDIELETFKGLVAGPNRNPLLGDIIYPLNKKLGIKFDFYMIDKVEDALKKEEDEDKILVLSRNLAKVYYHTAKHILDLTYDLEKAKLFYLRAIDLDPTNLELTLQYGLFLSSSTNFLDNLNAYHYVLSAAMYMTKTYWSNNDPISIHSYIEFIQKLEQNGDATNEEKEYDLRIYNLLREGYKIAKFDEFKSPESREMLDKYINFLFYGYRTIKSNRRTLSSIAADLVSFGYDINDFLKPEMIRFVRFTRKGKKLTD